MRRGDRPWSRIRPGDALFPDDALQLLGEGGGDDHLRQPVRGIGDLEEVGEFAMRLADGDEGRRAAASLGLVDGVPQIGRELAMAEPGFVGGDLHRNREEPVVVAVGVGLNQCLELRAASHHVPHSRCNGTPQPGPSMWQRVGFAKRDGRVGRW